MDIKWTKKNKKGEYDSSLRFGKVTEKDKESIELANLESEHNEKEVKREHLYEWEDRGRGVVICMSCKLKHGGRLNTGREQLGDDGHIYAIRDFDNYKKGDKII